MIFGSANLYVLLLACILDACWGDPEYPYHPIKLVGLVIQKTEDFLYKLGWHGFWGGLLLVVITLGLSLGAVELLRFSVNSTEHLARGLGWVNFVLRYGVELYLVYSLVALKDLNAYGQKIATAMRQHDLNLTRQTVAQICSRDTENLDFLAAGRATTESLSENFSDSWVSPLFWYSILGLPGLLMFKVVSTLDSMVGYKNKKYIHFGKSSARLDDWLNYFPARISGLMFVLAASLLPSYHAKKAGVAPFIRPKPQLGPNRIWPESTAAGALNIRLGGPIWRFQKLAEQSFIGLPESRLGANSTDIQRMILLNQFAATLFLGLCCVGLYYLELTYA